MNREELVAKALMGYACAFCKHYVRQSGPFCHQTNRKVLGWSRICSHFEHRPTHTQNVRYPDILERQKSGGR